MKGVTAKETTTETANPKGEAVLETVPGGAALALLLENDDDNSVIWRI